MPSLLLLLIYWHHSLELELALGPMAGLGTQYRSGEERIANGSATCAVGAFTWTTKPTESRETGGTTIGVAFTG